MSNFEFEKLPFVVKSLIASEIVHNQAPEMRVEFSLASNNCRQLVNDAKPRKVFKSAKIDFNNGIELELDVCLEIETTQELVASFENLQIIKSFEMTGFPGSWSQILDMAEGLKFVEEVTFQKCKYDHDTAKFVRKLQKCQDFSFEGIQNADLSLEIVDSFRFHRNIIIDGIADDRILEVIARKTNQENPNSYFLFIGFSKFSLKAYQRFLTDTTFENQEKLILQQNMFKKRQIKRAIKEIAKTKPEAKINHVGFRKTDKCVVM